MADSLRSAPPSAPDLVARLLLADINTSTGRDAWEAAAEIERLTNILKYARDPGKSVAPYVVEIERLTRELDDRRDELYEWMGHHLHYHKDCGERFFAPESLPATIERLRATAEVNQEVARRTIFEVANERDRLRALLREAENLAVLDDIDEDTETYGWGKWIKRVREALRGAGETK
jgi:hypothetical protein